MSDLQIVIQPVTQFQQNCAFIWNQDGRHGVVVDPGGEVERLMNSITKHGMTVDAILLTHGHIDHAGGAAELRELLGVEIIGPHKDDEPLLMGLEDQARMFGTGQKVRNVTPDRWLEEGDTVDIGGHSFDVLHCPGHSPGHVVFHNADMGFAHVGDVLFAGSIGRTDLPGGNHAQLIESIKTKLFPLGDETQFICGHGPGSTIGQERKTNPFLT